MNGRPIKHLVLLCISIFLLVGSQVARAEFLGLLNGRLADVSRIPKLSVDFGVVFADDSQLLGVRANYKLTPIFLVYANIAFSDLGPGDGLPVGVGALYTVENILKGFDVGLKLSYHRATFDVGDANFDATNLAFEVIGSTQRGFGPNGNFDFYANLGLQDIDLDFASDGVELSIGGGVIAPIGRGEVFVGVDLIDDAMFGGGFRLFF